MSSEAHEAACSCGRLNIRLSGSPRIVSSCHCLACQRRTGAIFGSTAFFGKDQIVATTGESRTFQRVAESGSTLSFRFCPQCGSTVFWENARLPDQVMVAVGAFADPTFPAPARTVWAKSRHPWLAFPDDVPSYPEAPK